MTTELKKFTEAYATMTIATYQPLFMKWISIQTVASLADNVARRTQKGKYIQLGGKVPTAQALYIDPIRPKIKDIQEQIKNIEPMKAPRSFALKDAAGQPIDTRLVRPIKIEGYPDAVQIGDKIYPKGALLSQNLQKAPARPGFFTRLFGSSDSKPAFQMSVQTLPTYIQGGIGLADADFEFHKTRRNIFKGLTEVIESWLTDPDNKNLAEDFAKAFVDKFDVPIYSFIPVKSIEEGLSPIGIAHFYRQHYFNVKEGVGPIEEAFTIAPLETLEVVYETVRRQIHEELVEIGSETVTEFQEETRNLDEVSDKVSSMIQRDASAAMSANASGTIGVWQAGASASVNLATSSQRSREQATRRLKETTKRASERITKSFSIKTRDIEDITTTNLTRRTINNESESPVSYGLRRVFRRVLVKVQDLGPRLVWQLYLRNPGAGLARSKFIHFREADPISIPDIPPGMPPRPQGGTDTGSTNSTIGYHSELSYWAVPIVINTGTDRQVVSVSIDSISDLEGGGKDDEAPSAINTVQTDPKWDETTNSYEVYVAVNPGDSSAVSVNYTYSYDPAGAVMAEWESERERRVRELEAEALNEQFERQKELITEKSSIRPRPANDLRREERYEVMNRLISQLFARGDDLSDPTPLEIEYFNRYFDLEGMFVYLHPSWWKPRYTPVATGIERPAYEITAESDPARMGKSLGWMIQLDGDTRRNAFINSPWLRVCLPIFPERERESIDWLAKHIEGEYGYDPQKQPLKKLLEDIEKLRSDQEALGVNGPDYVQVDSTVGAPDGPLRPESVFPIINEFEVTVPTDGFVYDELILSG